MSRRLTTAQLAALAIAATNARGRFRTGDPSVGGTVSAPTAKALRKLGLFDHEATSGWRPMAIGVWHQYRATATGRELIAIGRMLAPLAAGQVAEKFIPTHEIIVPGPQSRLAIPVMLDQGDLWQRSEYERRVPFPMWRLVNGELEYRHGVMPVGATVEEIAMCLQCGQPRVPKAARSRAATPAARRGRPPSPDSLTVPRMVRLSPAEAAADDAARGDEPWAEWDRKARAERRAHMGAGEAPAPGPTDPPTT